MDAFNNTATLQYQMDGRGTGERLTLNTCSDVMSCDIADLPMESTGRIAELNLRICNVCPGKRTAVAIQLHELDENDEEHHRGLRTLTLPAHNEQGPRDILLQNVRFVLPEDLSLSECNGSGSSYRRFVVRTLAHYVDLNYACPCNGND